MEISPALLLSFRTENKSCILTSKKSLQTDYFKSQLALALFHVNWVTVITNTALTSKLTNYVRTGEVVGKCSSERQAT
jgi:hypothetical protein